MKRILALLSIVCMAWIHVYSQQLSGVEAVDSLGTRVSLGKPASRVVSLSPAATEVLFAVGATVVGNTTYCIYPPEAASVEKVGGFSAKSLSIEKILSLRPDLVVSTGSIHKSITDSLATYGIPVYAYSPENFNSVASGIEKIAILTGNGQRGKQEASKFLAAIEKIETIVATIPMDQRLTVFWEVYNEPLMTCGTATFQHAILKAAGGRDIFSDLKGSWPRVSSEEVIARSPQVIMGADDHGDAMSYESVAARPGWLQIPAVKNRRIVLLPTYLVSGPGPRIPQGIYLAAKALYPRLFP
jgi:iron complex transport system substrate-binding protein